eukprot:635615-Alexandrium_andersonii.AAC.1
MKALERVLHAWAWPPAVYVADQGPEFVSAEFMQRVDGLGCRVWHCAAEAPWQNGICERSGQTLKAV